jgi:hypothetical protein
MVALILVQAVGWSELGRYSFPEKWLLNFRYVFGTALATEKYKE